MGDTGLIAVAPEPDRARSRLIHGVRLARFGACTALGLAVLLIPHLIWLSLTKGAPSPFGRRFHGLICWSIGLRVEVRGEPFATHALIVANHISWTDILALGSCAPMRFVAKSEVRRWPLLGWLARVNPTLFIDRGARCGVRGQIAALAKSLDRGRVALFPEGTTGNGSAVLPFNPALFEGADLRPVQPVSIRYRPRDRRSWEPGGLAEFAWDGDKPFLPHFLAVIVGSGADVCLTAHPPTATDDRKARALAARALIVQALEA